MPRTFTNREYCDIHYVYGFCDGNSEAAVQEYHRRFPNRRIPNSRVFTSTHRRIAEYGVGKTNDRGGNIPQRNNRILQLFNINPRLSTRRAAIHLGLSQSKVFRTLKRDKMVPFHFQPVQNLMPGDAEKRINFCRWVLESKEQDPQFLQKVLWTDEANFTRAGITNYHNLHVWSHDNPHAIRPSSFQHEFSVNVWLGILNNSICGPHFLPPRLNSISFLEFLQNYLPHLMDDILDDMPLDIRQNIWIQMDGAPAHYSQLIRGWLNENYNQRWIGRLPFRIQNEVINPCVGPVAWPPRSPDLNPLDYFAWGYLKEKVYSEPVNTREELQQRIENICNSLKRRHVTVSSSVNNLIKRCQKCIDSGGLHFEQLM